MACSLPFEELLLQKNTFSKVKKRLWEMEIGQEIFNPQSGNMPNSNYMDRPFAGYLYAGSTLYWLYNSEKVLKITIQLGIVGPSSFAEQTQILFHKHFGFYPINGWNTQIKNALGINSMVEYDYSLQHSTSYKSFDMTSVSYANLGTILTGVGTGLLLRLGALNPLFHSASTNSRIVSNAKNEFPRKEFFFYGKSMLNYRLYDATVEGGLFSSKDPVVFKIKPLVFSQELGLTYAKNRWTANFSVIFKTKEIQSLAKTDQYGSLTLCYRFSRI